jgi:hypothetical protein
MRRRQDTKTTEEKNTDLNMLQKIQKMHLIEMKSAPSINAEIGKTEIFKSLVLFSAKAASRTIIASFVPKTSAEKTGFGPVHAAQSLCICAALNSGFRTSMNSSNIKLFISLIGSALNATLSTINHFPNIIATVENIKTLKSIEIWLLTHVERYVIRKEE